MTTGGERATAAEAVLARLEAIESLLVEQAEHLRIESHRKQAIISEQSQRLREAEGGLFRELQLPLVSAMGGLVDRLTGYSGSDAVLAESVREELLEALAMVDIHPVPTGGGFDPALHRAAGTAAEPSLPDGAIVEVWSSGWARGRTVIRHASVVVNKTANSGPPPGRGRPAP
ncbi:hypothetical protein GCM10009830_01760 [Glycomyces endophyticus]|uniref:Nucleotide exchange factor GrpE n=1 Tax=Glycomyces endophyticus TaxID=480996 RepID=A0ABP4RTL4_9ACTN